MNTNPHNPNGKEFTPGSADETLRIIAGLPAPAGLEERVHAVLRAAPRRGRVLAWPEALRPQSSWMRTAAAAAIVFVVAGGGWGVYMHVEQNQPAKPSEGRNFGQVALNLSGRLPVCKRNLSEKCGIAF